MHPDLYSVNDEMAFYSEIDVDNVRYPFCIVWTPIPLLTWLFPFIGHMGICTSTGIIRDFGGPFYVGENSMAFGDPVKYWKLDPKKVPGGPTVWDQAISEAADVYKTRMHSLLFDNCHSMVALALNKMRYDNYHNWGMVNLAFYSFIKSKFISCTARVRTYLPFYTLLSFAILMIFIEKCKSFY